MLLCDVAPRSIGDGTGVRYSFDDEWKLPGLCLAMYLQASKGVLKQKTRQALKSPH